LGSAGAVPAFGKWDKGPGELIVVGRFRWRIYDPQGGQKVFLRRAVDRHSDASSSGRTQLRSHRAREFGERGDFDYAQHNCQQKLGRAQVMIDPFFIAAKGAGKTAVFVSRLFNRVIA